MIAGKLEVCRQFGIVIAITSIADFYSNQNNPMSI